MSKISQDILSISEILDTFFFFLGVSCHFHTFFHTYFRAYEQRTFFELKFKLAIIIIVIFTIGMLMSSVKIFYFVNLKLIQN